MLHIEQVRLFSNHRPAGVDVALGFDTLHYLGYPLLGALGLAGDLGLHRPVSWQRLRGDEYRHCRQHTEDEEANPDD